MSTHASSANVAHAGIGGSGAPLQFRWIALLLPFAMISMTWQCALLVAAWLIMAVAVVYVIRQRGQ